MKFHCVSVIQIKPKVHSILKLLKSCIEIT